MDTPPREIHPGTPSRSSVRSCNVKGRENPGYQQAGPSWFIGFSSVIIDNSAFCVSNETIAAYQRWAIFQSSRGVKKTLATAQHIELESNHNRSKKEENWRGENILPQAERREDQKKRRVFFLTLKNV